MEGTQKFAEVLLRYENLIIMLSAWVCVGLIGKIFPKLNVNKIWARFVPLAPFVFTMGMCWLPGLLPPETGIGERILMGVILGWGSGHTHKILKQTIFGRDSRIDGPKDLPDEEKTVP